MNEKQTIEGSKRAFLKLFQHVIPPLYRRVIDELLVELNLLSHQKDFQQNFLFSIGIKEVFTTFTQGYQPIKHLPLLFDSLCRGGGFDPSRIKSQSNKLVNGIKPENIDDIKSLLTNEMNQFNYKSYYSRLMAIGLYGIVKDIEMFDKRQIAISESIKLSEVIGMPHVRVEKDLKLYNTNIERLDQAVQLMKESAVTEQRKREESNENINTTPN